MHVIAVLGTTLDRATGAGRWARWRPTVALGQHDDFEMTHLDLLYGSDHAWLRDQVVVDLAAVSPETTVACHEVDLADPWDLEEVYDTLASVVERLDLARHPEGPLVHITTGSHVMQICWFLLTEARIVPGRLLQLSPPTRRREGSWSILDLDLARYDRIATRFAARRAASLSSLKGGIDTRSSRFNALIAELETVATASTEPILLLGPTGSGKTRLARRVYEVKQERGDRVGPLVEVDCATLRGDQAMSALFGHVRGAFTGAEAAREGLLRRAHRGVLFLDEIGELGLDEQAMLLRALEDRQFLPLGADEVVHSDFQLLAGTRVDLQEAVRVGRFRDDLLARIDLWTFELPALSERLEDLQPNLEFELERAGRSLGRRVAFNREAEAAYLAAAEAPSARWSGNFRDLRASVQRMATFAGQGRIDVGIVDAELARLQRRWGSTPAGDDLLAEVLSAEARDALDRFDAVQLREVVAVCRRSASLAAAGRTLFAASLQRRRSRNDGDRLRKYLQRFGLDFASVQAASSVSNHR
jgi:transcriptional regulatory protein RtcR